MFLWCTLLLVESMVLLVPKKSVPLKNFMTQFEVSQLIKDDLALPSLSFVEIFVQHVLFKLYWVSSWCLQLEGCISFESTRQ